MNHFDVLQIVVMLGTLTLLTPPLGRFMAKVYQGENTFLTPVIRPFEQMTYRLTGVDATHEMNWKEYAKSILIFSILGLVIVFLIQMFQGELPLNPQKLKGLSWHLAFNTAVSFVTNTNWQSYGGEGTMSYFTQMVALAVQNFLSAATGMVVLLVLIRGFVRKSSDKIGNFWVDMTRSTLYILLPLSILFAVILVSQGVIQNFSPAEKIVTIEGTEQVIPLGPAASQVAIKQLGTNGGGYFNANSAHPMENPTPLSNFLEMLALLLIPAALTYTFGIMVGSRRQGWAIYATMMSILVLFLGLSLWSEYSNNPLFQQTASMEGKETRFGITNSVMWSVFTTAASNGSVNAMHDSLSPISGGLAMLNMMLGEIIFGGVGCGLYGMILFAILTVFLSGLMVGRTPEYLGKKIESRDIQMTILAIIAPSAMILVGSGIATASSLGLSSLANQGPHGLSEMVYAFSSAGGNNGSAFAGLNASTAFYNVALALTMLVGRFGVLFPVLAIAGNMACKKSSPPSFGTFTTDNLLFVVLLIGVILIVGALTFFPVLSLGPIVEHFLMHQGKTF